MFKRLFAVVTFSFILLGVYLILNPSVKSGINIDTHAQQTQETNKKVTSKMEPVDQKGKTGNVNDAIRNGIFKNVRNQCRRHAVDLLNYLGFTKPDAGVVVFYDAESKAKMITGMVSSKGPTGDKISSFSLSQDNSCAMSYETTQLWNETCDNVHKNYFSQFKYINALNSYTRIFEMVDDLQVYMSDYPNNVCMTIQKEAIFNSLTRVKIEENNMEER